MSAKRPKLTRRVHDSGGALGGGVVTENCSISDQILRIGVNNKFSDPVVAQVLTLRVQFPKT